MRRFFIIPAVLLVLIITVLFWEPIIDFLPIDQSGWSTNEHGQCYLDEDGDPVSGWYDIEGVSYYFAPETCTPHTGWTEKNGVRCYVADGLPVSGWTELEEGRYYLNADGSIYTGWLEENGRRMYLGADGFPASGWTDTPEGRFYLDEAGVPCTGIAETNTGYYCFKADGTPHAGWFEQDGKRYFANPDGSLYTGWLELDGKKYYLKEDGTAAVGKLEIDGEEFFFSSTGMNFILVNPWHDLPEDFSVDLVVVEGASVDPVCQADLEEMFADCRAAGYSPQILSGYRSILDQSINFQNAIRQRIDQGYGYNTAYNIVRQIIAVPGTSEHHLGLALDIVDTRYPYLDYGQEKMETQKWLMENSWKYGFIMRYPNGATEITGIIYEPWHYRYVGKEMAKEIYEMGVCLEVYVDMLTNDGTTCGGKTISET